MKTEKNLHNYFRKKCLLHKIFFRKLGSTSGRGFPDVLVMHGGVLVFVELKSPQRTGRLSPLQVACIAEMQGEGADVRVMSQPGEVDDLIDELLSGH